MTYAVIKASSLLATGLSLIALLGCLIVGPIISSEIAALWSELDEDIGYFKQIYEQTWNEMMEIRKKGLPAKRQTGYALPNLRNGQNIGAYGSPMRPPAAGIIAGQAPNIGAMVPQVIMQPPAFMSPGFASQLPTFINSISEPQCSCSSEDNGCEPGPPGPMGAPGDQGQHGEAGADGQNGQNADNAKSVMGALSHCIQCPRGPRGPAGPPGKRGMAGGKGIAGMPGIGGMPGLTGVRGGQGPKGRFGHNGNQGPAGQPGEAGTGGKGQRGEKGVKGIMGYPGSIGFRGLDGNTGPPGPPGSPGIIGNPGINGMNGASGFQGMPGVVGPDGQYCPCPVRTVTQVSGYKLKKSKV